MVHDFTFLKLIFVYEVQVSNPVFKVNAPCVRANAPDIKDDMGTGVIFLVCIDVSANPW